MRPYLFLFFGVARVFLGGKKHFFGAFERALRGDTRCIMAFRHPNGGEPQLLTWFILFRLGALAKKEGIAFAKRPRALFIYGYEVLRWGGWVARLVMPGLGAMPIYHAKIDSQGLGRIYQDLLSGPYPLAMAPEGQVTYNVERVLNLEQGTMRIGFSVAERLIQAGKSFPVEILPVSIHFRYGIWGKICLKWLMKRIEKFTGFSALYKKEEVPDFTTRLRNCRDYLIAKNESRYGIARDENRTVPDRITLIIEAGLRRAEQILGIKPTSGETISRLYLIRQICWDRIFLPGRDTLKGLPRLERAQLDLAAGEAWHACRHTEVVDFIWYFHSALPEENAPLHEKIEFAQNLWDFANRTMGGSYATRNINIYPRRVIIQAAAPINLTERLPAYQKDRKATIQTAMDDLLQSYLNCIKEVNETEKE
ncbi:acyltransferase [Treponema primitia]|nr:acyltransferase [Treponema primitia]